MMPDIDAQILTFLHLYGVTEKVEIEDDAKRMILSALSGDNVERVTIDDGALVIEYKD